MIYLKYATCADDIVSQHKAASIVRDYILYYAFGIKKAKRLVVKTKRGKPYIKDANFDFSTAHTGCVAIAAACGEGEKKEGLICIDKSISRIGIDIELEDRRLSHKTIKLICEKFFSEKECNYVAVGTKGEKGRFLEVWTRKESIVKATGEGLSVMHMTDSFGKGIKFLKTRRIRINSQNYILSVAGI